MVGKKHPATGCDQGLPGPKTDDADIAERADRFPVESGSQRLGGIVDDQKRVLFCESTDVIDSSRSSEEVRDENGPGLSGNQTGNLLRVDVQRVIDIRKNRNTSGSNYRQHRAETAK